MEQVPRPTDALFTEIIGNCYIATGGQLNQILSRLFVSSEYQPIPSRFKKPENGLFIAQHRFYPAFTATAGTQFNTIPQDVYKRQFLLLRDRSLLAEIDYSLLGTFLAFFIFIGNLGNIEEFRNFLVSILSGHEELVSVLTSQVISNVPAALLLSGFTSNWQALIVGCNLGGLGTLIASMASLISYKLVVKEYPEKKKGYFIYFTLANIAFLIILLGVSYLL